MLLEAIQFKKIYDFNINLFSIFFKITDKQINSSFYDFQSSFNSDDNLRKYLIFPVRNHKFDFGLIDELIEMSNQEQFK